MALMISTEEAVAVAVTNEGDPTVADDILAAAIDEAAGQTPAAASNGDETGNSAPAADSSPAVPTEPTDGTTATIDLQTLQKELRSLRQELSRRQDLETDVAEQSRTVERLAADVLSCESRVEGAKGELKAAREDYETGVRELRGLVRDLTSGQGRLNLEGEAGDGAGVSVEITAGPNGEVVATAEKIANIAGMVERVAAEDHHAADPITVLSQKDVRLLLGNDEFQRLKDIGTPVGMTPKEIELLEGADITTIGGLEKRMRDDAWWFKSFGRGWGESKTSKVIESLQVFRARWPQPQPAYVVELAETATGAPPEVATDVAAPPIASEVPQ